jgi:hypothetical protein
VGREEFDHISSVKDSLKTILPEFLLNVDLATIDMGVQGQGQVELNVQRSPTKVRSKKEVFVRPNDEIKLRC